MTEPTGQTDNRVPCDRLRLVVCITGLAVFALLIYSDLIARTYLQRVVLTAVCMGVTGLAYGYGPQSEDRGWRNVSIMSITLWPAIMAINPLARFVDLQSIPADQRYAEMIKPHYFIPVLVFVICSLSCYMVGSILYRHRYPEQAFIPIPEEDKPKPEDEAAARRTLIRLAIPIVIWFGLALVLMWLLPHHSTHILLVAGLGSICLLSALAGYRWPEPRRVRWFWPVMAVVAPAAGFAGFYGAARVQDDEHLVRAIWFAGWVAAAWVLPFLMCRAIIVFRGHRNGGRA